MVNVNSDTPREDEPAAAGAPDATEQSATDDLADVLADAADALESGTEGEAPTPSNEILEKLIAEDASEGIAEEPAANAVEVLAAELADTKDRLLRAMAETENIRRRAERDKAETAKYAVTNFARDMLSVADNVRRALDSLDADARKESQAMENLVVGLEMVERETKTTLERHGVKPIAAIGERFNSNLHEALYEIPDPSQPAGTVGQVVEAGYTLHDRLLRPAKVGVTKGGPKAEAAAPATPDSAGDATAKGAKTAYEGGPNAAGGRVDESL